VGKVEDGYFLVFFRGVDRIIKRFLFVPVSISVRNAIPNFGFVS
jgi:hypothetical protein